MFISSKNIIQMKFLLILVFLLSFCLSSCGGREESRRRFPRDRPEGFERAGDREGSLARRAALRDRDRDSSARNREREAVVVRVIAEERQGPQSPSEQEPETRDDTPSVQVRVAGEDASEPEAVPQQTQVRSGQGSVQAGGTQVTVVREGNSGSKIVVQQSVQVSSGQAVSEEKFIFPVILNPNHEAISIEATLEKNKVSISAEPKNVPITLIANLSGKVFVIEEGKYYNIFIDSATDSRTPHFRLIRKHTDILVSSGEVVEQKQKLAITTKPITFYIKTGEELLGLCIPSFDGGKVSVINRAPDPSDCIRQTVEFTISAQ